ncbi:hypothetical protein [Streptomyces kebangsaanensis]|nr:hypothetical protein [Streptomyces kebangsaanensis]
MRSALRKRPNGLACAAAAHFPASTRLRREHVPAAGLMQPSHPTIGSGR